MGVVVKHTATNARIISIAPIQPLVRLELALCAHLGHFELVLVKFPPQLRNLCSQQITATIETKFGWNEENKRSF